MARPFPRVPEDRMPFSREFDLCLRPGLGALCHLVRKPTPVAIDDPGFDGLLIVAQGAGTRRFFDLEACRISADVFQVSATGIGDRR